ncbi:MAG: carotenoid biosynthesis protein [Methanospirillum sp.]|nr:carotenoid biosynthesis protein [Methanospirillum sp.]
MARGPLAVASLLFLIAGLATRVRPQTPFDQEIAAAVVVLLALPSFLALERSEGTGRSLVLVFFLSVLSMAVEAIGVLTGIPYGAFSYSPALGSPLVGPVPWTVGFAYVPLLLGASSLARRYGSSLPLPAQAALSGLLLVAVDLVLDPAAVTLGYWSWVEVGAYHGIPASNFAGWLLTGTFYSAITLRASRGGLPEGVASSFLLILAYWTGVCLGLGLAIPVVVGGGLLAIAGVAPPGRAVVREV